MIHAPVEVVKSIKSAVALMHNIVGPCEKLNIIG